MSHKIGLEEEQSQDIKAAQGTILSSIKRVVVPNVARLLEQSIEEEECKAKLSTIGAKKS